MHPIPVQFTLHGRTVHAWLIPDHPTANSWSLNVGERYSFWHWGSLTLYHNGEWGFRWNKAELREHEDYFVQVLISYYQ